MKKIIEKRNYIILTIIIVLLLLLLIGNNNKGTKKYNYFNENIIVNIYKVKDTSKVFEDIDDIYKKYNKFYKNVDSTSDKDIIKLLKYGKKLYKKSNGLIDITTKTLQEKIENDETYNFETTIKDLNLKNKETLTNLNLDSIIGAYATNEVVKYLKKENVDNFLINEDGNIIAGKYYDNGKYKISIIDKNEKLIKILKVEKKAIAVKGNTNILKPYMINPITSSKNKTNDLIVVIDKNINKANAKANILYLMEESEREKYIKKHHITALWQHENVISNTKSFKKYIK